MTKLISLIHLSNSSPIIILETSKPKDQTQTNSLNGVAARGWAFILRASDSQMCLGEHLRGWENACDIKSQ